MPCARNALNAYYFNCLHGVGYSCHVFGWTNAVLQNSGGVLYVSCTICIQETQCKTIRTAGRVCSVVLKQISVKLH